MGKRKAQVAILGRSRIVGTKAPAPLPPACRTCRGAGRITIMVGSVSHGTTKCPDC